MIAVLVISYETCAMGLVNYVETFRQPAIARSGVI